jgi:hypothetical protein
MDWPLRLRPLPRFVAPFRDETISSYLPRLTAANRLAPAALRALFAAVTVMTHPCRSPVSPP